MTTMTKNDKTTMLDLFFSWLIGAGFTGFKFDTSFSLFFIRDKAASFRGIELPWLIELHLLGNWWFGSADEWKNVVESQGKGIEPDEPVKASELAFLRWSGGSTIKNISIVNNEMILTFESNVKLLVSLQCEDDYVFTAKEAGVNEEDAEWSVTCDGENYYYRAKE